MSLFQVEDQAGPTAAELAAGFKKLANQRFEQLIQEHRTDFEAFWTREEGDTRPAGLDVLKAAGTSAQAMFTFSFARIQLILSMDPTALTEAEYLPPVAVAFNEDGSVVE